MSGATVRVDLGARSYDIAIGPGLSDEAGRRIAAVLPGARLAVVTDETVAALHLTRLEGALAAAGLEATPIVVPAGEPSKSFATLERVVEEILAARLERSDAVLAFGGGVVGDLAGFAAAIARRGMALVQIPTSLLAQVDSSVGGKTGINSGLGKNLVGAFHQPRLVLADTALLDTLPRREFAAGYAEVAKYGLIDDAAFFAWLEANHAAVFAGGPERQQAIAHSCRAKAAIVARDEEEKGERALLNLGHTFGHALEAFCGYDPARLIHGEGVAIGLALAHDFSAAEGLAPAADAERVRRHLEEVGLPSRIGAIAGGRPSADALMRHIAQDKKVRRGRLTFVLSRGIGRAFIGADVDPARIHAFLEQQLLEHA
ncbi:MAG TPA: 3-dehydroquinate synthase [Afifellaceae bacterium]|nr:3-dehydroquinate synthase [Afifellaceae bacterium]